MAEDLFYDGPLRNARVLVVDDDDLTVRAIRRVLEACGARVDCRTTVVTARSAVIEADLPFDAAVVDYDLMEGGCGLDVLELLRRGPYPCASLMITGSHDPEKCRRSLQAGADDFLLKPVDVVDFLKLLEELVSRNAERRRRLSRTNARDGVDHASPFQQPDPLATIREKGSELRRSTVAIPDLEAQAKRIAERGGLTRREHQVLERILLGLTNTEISGALGISTRTVKFHVRNVLRKLGCENRSGLAAHLWRDGPVPSAQAVDAAEEPGAAEDEDEEDDEGAGAGASGFDPGAAGADGAGDRREAADPRPTGALHLSKPEDDA